MLTCPLTLPNLLLLALLTALCCPVQAADAPTGPFRRPAATESDATGRADDPRPHQNEYQLKDINRRLEAAQDQEIVVQNSSELTYTGKGVVLKKRSADDSDPQALRGNLHRLHREVRESQTPHTREHLIEDQLDTDP